MACLPFVCALALVALASADVRASCPDPKGLVKTCVIPLGYPSDSGAAKPNCTDIFADRSHARSLFNAITNHGKVPLSSDCVQCSADQSLTEWSNTEGKVCTCVPIPVSTDPPCRCVLSRLGLRGTFNLTLLGAFPCDIDVSHNGFTEIASTASSAPKLQRLIINNNQLNSIPVSDVGTGSGLPSQLRYLDASSNTNLKQSLPSLEKFPAALEYLSFANCPEVHGALQVPATQTSNLMTFLLTHSKVNLSSLCDTFRAPFFSKLKHLYLSDNMQMTGEVHVTDSCFSSALVNVVLQGCQFINMFTVTPSTLTELECVDVSGNSFGIPATTALHNLSFPGGRLRTLVMTKCMIGGNLPVLDGNTIPRSMQFLDLSGNTISGTLQLGDFSSPFHLDLSDNDLQALSFVSTKRPLANLSFLMLAHNMISSAVDMLALSEVATLDLSENRFKSPTSQLVALYPNASWLCIALNDNYHAGLSLGLTGGLDIRNFSTTLGTAFFKGNNFSTLHIENDIFAHRNELIKISVDEALCLEAHLKAWPEKLCCSTLDTCVPSPTTQPPSKDSEDSFFSKPIGLLVVCLSVVLVVGAAGAILWIRKRHAGTESQHELSRFFNRGFALGEKIGGGAFGTVYRVKRTTDNREFALKEVNFEREDTWQEALHEFNIMKKAQGERLMPHPNIVQLEVMYMSWRNDDNDAEQSEPDHLLNGEVDKPHRSQKVMCLVMEFFHDGTLKDRIDRKAMTEREFVVILKQLLNALVYLHNLNPPIIHRDIKPENVLLEGERVALSDFGLSSARLNAVSNAGTPNYQAPEIGARRKYTTKVDVFSTGAVAYSMMTRRCGRQMKKMQAECRKPNFFAELEAEMEMGAFSPELIQFVLWMLTIDPDQRPTAEEAQKRLDDLAPEVTIHHIVSVPIFTPDAGR